MIWPALVTPRANAVYCTPEARNPLLSPLDMIVIGAAALLFFGPDQLPKVARKVGTVVRDVQTTSQAFIREMERAADEQEAAEAAAHEPPPAEPEPEREKAPEQHAP
jgi:Sec-independent protein translocase protein TatA